MENNNKKGIIAIIGLAVLGGIGLKKCRVKGQKALQQKVDETQPKPITKYNDEGTINTVVVESIDPLDLEKNFKEVSMDEMEINNWKSLICNTSSEFVRTSIINGSFSGLLKCDIPLSELAKSTTDPSAMRGFVTSNGKISQQANFKEVGLSELAPSIIFSCLSLLTSQYYLNGIWNELHKINEHNRKMERHTINKDLSTLETKYNRLKEIDSKTKFCDLDFKSAEDAADEIEITLGTYQNNLENNIDLNVTSNWNDFEEAKNKVSKLNESSFFTYFDIVMRAELLNYFAKIILLKIAMNLNKTEDVHNSSTKIKLSSWNNYVSIFKMVKHDVLKYLELEAESSFLSKNKINKLKEECETKFQQTETLINNTYLFVSQPITNYLYIDDNGTIKKYVKEVTAIE